MQNAANRNQAPLFSPFFSGKTEKKGPSETSGSHKFATTIPQSPSVPAPFPQGSLGFVYYIVSPPAGASLFLKMGAKNPPEDSSEGHLFRSIRHQASLFIFSVIWLFLRAAAFL